MVNSLVLEVLPHCKSGPSLIKRRLQHTPATGGLTEAVGPDHQLLLRCFSNLSITNDLDTIAMQG
jgi:hypothetical protein